jgi:DNA-binding NarL/FixJ family response regulator
VEIVAEAINFNEAIVLSEVLKPDILLLDVHMPDEREHPPHLVKQEVRHHVKSILAMSIWNGERAKELAAVLGARLLLDKTKLFSDLLPAIRNCRELKKKPRRVHENRGAASTAKARTNAV